MNKNENLSAEQLASKLEQKAKRLREEGLSEKDLERLSGGGLFGECCGSSCSTWSGACSHDKEGLAGCKNSCIYSSPD